MEIKDSHRLVSGWRIGLLIVVSMVIIIAIYEWIRLRGSSQVEEISVGAARPEVTKSSPIADEARQSKLVYLYFVDLDGRNLKAEEQTIQYAPGEPSSLARGIVNFLIQGPKSGLLPSLPKTITLNAVYIDRDGTGYVDISTGGNEALFGGIMTEYLSVFSVVNSLVLNVPEITRVKILIGGREAVSMGGHIDLRKAYEADMVLIK